MVGSPDRGRQEGLGNPLFANEASRVGVLCPEQGYSPVARPRSVGGLFRTFGRHLRGTCSQTLRRRVVQPHIQEGLRLGARASGAFRETVRLCTSAWRSGVGERQVIGLNAHRQWRPDGWQQRALLAGRARDSWRCFSGCWPRLTWSAGDHPEHPPLEVQASGRRTGHTGLQDPATRVTPKAVYSAWRPGQDGGSRLHCALDIPARSQEGDRVARALRELITTQERLVVQ